MLQNPHTFDLTKADVVAAPVVDLRGLNVGVPGHALRDGTRTLSAPIVEFLDK